MSASPNPVAPGGSLLYSITVTNNGSDPATGVTLSDILPAGTTFQSLSAPSGWTTTTPAVGATGTASATIASLAAGGSASFSLVVQVDPSAANGSSIEDTASVASTSTDPDSSNNSASRSVTVQTSSSISPTSTGLVSSLNPATVGQAITFTASVGGTSSTGAQPTGFLTFTIDGVSQSPVAISAVGGGVGATLETSTLSVGSHQVTVAYSGDANFAPSVSSTVVEVVSAAATPPPAGSGPELMKVQRFGFHMMPTRLVLTFDRSLDATAADNLSNYRIKTMSGGRIKLKSAVYDDQTHTVTLRPVNRMNLHRKYSIDVVGSQPTGVEDVAGNMLDGTRIGHLRHRLPWPDH